LENNTMSSALKPRNFPLLGFLEGPIFHWTFAREIFKLVNLLFLEKREYAKLPNNDFWS